MSTCIWIEKTSWTHWSSLKKVIQTHFVWCNSIFYCPWKRIKSIPPLAFWVWKKWCVLKESMLGYLVIWKTSWDYIKCIWKVWKKGKTVLIDFLYDWWFLECKYGVQHKFYQMCFNLGYASTSFVLYLSFSL